MSSSLIAMSLKDIYYDGLLLGDDSAVPHLLMDESHHLVNHIHLTCPDPALPVFSCSCGGIYTSKGYNVYTESLSGRVYGYACYARYYVDLISGPRPNGWYDTGWKSDCSGEGVQPIYWYPNDAGNRQTYGLNASQPPWINSILNSNGQEVCSMKMYKYVMLFDYGHGTNLMIIHRQVGGNGTATIPIVGKPLWGDANEFRGPITIGISISGSNIYGTPSPASSASLNELTSNQFSATMEVAGGITTANISWDLWNHPIAEYSDLATFYIMDAWYDPN